MLEFCATNDWIDLALECGADKAAVIPVSALVFSREFRAACEQNSCGKYDANWMCPPDAGNIDELIERAKSFQFIFVFQTIAKLEDSFDIEGMERAADEHNKILQRLRKKIIAQNSNLLCLGAGGCHVCACCSKIDNEPCRYPDDAISSLETYGIAVSEMAATAGMRYINGQNTVTYFGGFLYYI